jgi:hypothetical protein
MKRDFDELLAEVKDLFSKLIAMKSVTREDLGECNYFGVYLFSEQGKHLYCGRTRRPLRTRLLEHSRPSVKDAPFAFRLAREVTGKTSVTYAVGDGRKELLKDKVFLAELALQKERIGKMDVRYIRADDALTQTLLEIYTAAVLETPYNEFKTT